MGGGGRENIPRGLKYFYGRGLFLVKFYQKYTSKRTIFKDFLVGAPYLLLKYFHIFSQEKFYGSCTMFWEVCFNILKYSAQYNTVFIIFI